MTPEMTIRSSAAEAQSLSLEDRALLDAALLRRIARDAREGVHRELYECQLDRFAHWIEVLAARSKECP